MASSHEVGNGGKSENKVVSQARLSARESLARETIKEIMKRLVGTPGIWEYREENANKYMPAISQR